MDGLGDGKCNIFLQTQEKKAHERKRVVVVEKNALVNWQFPDISLMYNNIENENIMVKHGKYISQERKDCKICKFMVIHTI